MVSYALIQSHFGYVHDIFCILHKKTYQKNNRMCKTNASGIFWEYHPDPTEEKRIWE